MGIASIRTSVFPHIFENDILALARMCNIHRQSGGLLLQSNGHPACRVETAKD